MKFPSLTNSLTPVTVLTPVRYFSSWGGVCCFSLKSIWRRKRQRWSCCVWLHNAIWNLACCEIRSKRRRFVFLFFLKGKVSNVGFCVVSDVGVKSLDSAVHKEFLQCVIFLRLNVCVCLCYGVVCCSWRKKEIKKKKGNAILLWVYSFVDLKWQITAWQKKCREKKYWSRLPQMASAVAEAVDWNVRFVLFFPIFSPF
jgi:hypothetical protein